MNKHELQYVLKHMPESATEIFVKGGNEYQGSVSPNTVSFQTKDDGWQMPPAWRQVPAYRGGRRFVWVGRIPQEKPRKRKPLSPSVAPLSEILHEGE